jgi:hypothetical protein
MMRLELCAPLIYGRTANLPLDSAEFEETLCCFSLDSGQSRSIEPVREQLLGTLVFTGQKNAECDLLSAQTVSLPAGVYLFTQHDGALEGEEWLDMAIEQQKDGLWERYKPQNLLYVRYLFEDGRPVTQLFRPLEGYPL